MALAESLTTLAISSPVSLLSSMLAGLAMGEDLEMLDLREAGMQNVMRRSSIRKPERCHPTQRKIKSTGYTTALPEALRLKMRNATPKHD